MRTPSEKYKDRWLDAALPLVAETGWSNDTLAKAADIAGLSPGEQALAAPHGVNDLIDHFMQQASQAMRDQLDGQDLSALRVHERVALAIKTWLGELEPYRAAVGRAAARGMMPWGSGAATRRLWKIADAVWAAAGDTATDYNRQTKRALLSAVLPSIVLRWLTNPGDDVMDRHIARRLKQAMQLGRFGGKLAAPILDRLNRQS